MADLTSEEIALGLRAANAMALTEGLVVASEDGRRWVVTALRGGSIEACPLGGDRIHQWWAGDCPLIPDPTARGFVSAALAQVRERTGKVLICRAYMADRWRVEDTRGVPLSDRGDERTEAAAVVAALEATR